MNANNYQQLAIRTMANQEAIHDRIAEDVPTAMIQFMNGLVGLMDEVGEISSIYKKSVEYNQGTVDKVHRTEEIGDCFWRLAQIASSHDILLGDCLNANIEKLRIRYPEKYSDREAANRDLVAERNILQFNSTGFGEPEWIEEGEDLSPEVLAVEGEFDVSTLNEFEGWTYGIPSEDGDYEYFFADEPHEYREEYGFNKLDWVNEDQVYFNDREDIYFRKI